MMFYALFGLLILGGRAVYPLFAGWLAVILLGDTLSLPVRFPMATHPFNLLFLMGVATAALSFKLGQWRHRSRIAGGLAMAGVVIFGLSAVYSSAKSSPAHIVPWDSLPYILAFGSASTFLLFAPLSDRIEAFFGRRKGLLFLGDASYSIYLIHYPLVKLLATWMKKIPRDQPFSLPWVAGFGLLAMAAVIVALGGLFYRKVEFPLLSFLRRVTAPGRPQ